MGIVRTEGVVLRTYPFSETSKIVHAFTLDFGTESLLAKGARRQASRFGGALETFTRSELVYYRRKTSTLHVLSECSVIDSYVGLAGDLAKFYAGSAGLEMVKKFSMPEETNPELYRLLTWSLASMAAGERADVESILVFFTWRFLSLLGFRPDFTTCASCGREMAGPALLFANERAAGGVCEACARRTPPAHAVHAKAADIIDTISSRTEPGEDRASPEILAGLWKFTRSYMAIHLHEEREISSITAFLGLVHPALRRSVRN
jgi:DNA repair protein RecO (recombination protein O)